MYAIAYYRISKDDECAVNALLTQQMSCESWATSNQINIYRSYSDNGISGGTPVTKRPRLLEAIRYLADGDILLVHKRDRLARDLYTIATIEYMVRQRGARIVSVAGEGTASDDPASVMMRHMIDVFAEHELCVISQRTKAALAAKRERNEVSGTIPIGYQLAPDGIHLEPCPHEQACILRILDLHSQGLTRRKIRLAMDKEMSARGKTWSDKTIKGILEQYRSNN